MSSRVLIVGGGVASLEAEIALQDMAGDRVDVEIYSPHEDFVYLTFAATEPFGISHAMRYDLRRLAERCDARFHLASINHVDGEAKRARTHDGEEIAYDYLMVACGTRLLAGVAGALNFWGVPDDPKVRDAVRDLRDWKLKRAVFTMPAGGTWALPLDQLALLAESELSKAGVDDSSLTRRYTGGGASASLWLPREQAVSDLLAERDIDVIAGATPIKYDSGLSRSLPAPPSRPTSS